MEPPLGDADACQGFDGNSDLYGIGIRIGVYLSWYASFTANLWANGLVDELSDTNTLFILSNLVAVAFGASRRLVSSVEAFIVLGIFAGYFFGSWTVAGLRVGAFCTSSSKIRFEGRTLPICKNLYFRFLGGFSVAGFGLRLLLALAATAFSAWFFFHGADALRDGMCEYKIFLFGTHSLFGPIRAFLKVYSALICVLMGVVYLPVFMHLFFSMMLPIVALIMVAVCCDDFNGDGDQIGFKEICVMFTLGAGLVTNLSGTDWDWDVGRSVDAESLRRPTGRGLQRCLGIDGCLPRIFLRCVAFILRNHRQVIGTVGLVTSTWTIAVIELTIKLNGIRGVNQLTQTSQLIPFVLGCALFLGTVRKAIIQRGVLRGDNARPTSIRTLSSDPGSVQGRDSSQDEGKPAEAVEQTACEVPGVTEEQPPPAPLMKSGLEEPDQNGDEPSSTDFYSKGSGIAN